MSPVHLDFPKFDGSDPLNCLFRAEQFSYYVTPDSQRLTIAAVHFEGSAVPWFQMLYKTNQLTTWADLPRAVEEQFDPSMFDCPRAQLFKLTQSGSVADYYSQFMILANRVDGLTDAALLDCFISGLRDPIRREVIAQSPQSMLRVVSLARLFDEKVSLGLPSRAPRTNSFSNHVKSISSSASTNAGSHSSPLHPLLPKPLSKPMSPALVKRISPAELQLCWEKGLCFTCDEKYSWNHKCPNKHLMLLFYDLDDPPGEPSSDLVAASSPDTDNDGSSPPLHHLSLHAYHGSPSCATIRFQGTISGKPVQVLLDGASSDSFI
ncbi:Retrotransposon gag domain [Sesbania bispinosa]|nr:Retrotransposon gag domain [Sesbania bispinosa]